jgi:hypothetical protein
MHRHTLIDAHAHNTHNTQEMSALATAISRLPTAQLEAAVQFLAARHPMVMQRQVCPSFVWTCECVRVCALVRGCACIWVCVCVLLCLCKRARVNAYVCFVPLAEPVRWSE